MQPFYPEYELTRTQDLEPAYHDAGQFYWGKPDAWLTNDKVHRNGVGLPIPNWRVVDIDTPDDWERAELLYAAINK
jgi:N-acylneuraminate cytidylyltransferase